MAIFDRVTKEVKAVISMVILIVIGSVILLKFKDVSGVTAGLNTTIDNSVTYISEPVSWVVIAIVGLIGFALFKMYSKKNSM